jgi:hypothetical protein
MSKLLRNRSTSALRGLVTGRIRAWHLAPALVGYGVAAAVMFGPWPGLIAGVRERCGGLDPFDVRGFWTPEDARDLVRTCGPAGRDAYLGLELADLLYPAVAGAALLVVTALLLRRSGGRGWPLLLPVIAMTVLDYAENLTVWTLLLRWPDVDPIVAIIGGPVTAAKRSFGFIAFTVPIVLATVAVTVAGVRAIGRRLRPGRHPRRRGPAVEGVTAP